MVLDNIYAIPEPSALLLAASGLVLALRRYGPRNSFRPDASSSRNHPIVSFLNS